MAIGLAILLISVGTAMTGAFVAIEHLIRHEYDVHRADWERDGRPTGFVFCPPEARFFLSRLAFHSCSLRWLFWTPDWVAKDPSAHALLRRLRWFVLIGNGGILMGGILIWYFGAASSSV